MIIKVSISILNIFFEIQADIKNTNKLIAINMLVNIIYLSLLLFLFFLVSISLIIGISSLQLLLL